MFLSAADPARHAAQTWSHQNTLLLPRAASESSYVAAIYPREEEMGQILTYPNLCCNSNKHTDF